MEVDWLDGLYWGCPSVCLYIRQSVSLSKLFPIYFNFNLLLYDLAKVQTNNIKLSMWML